MGWLVALAGIALLVALKFKAADRVTFRNMTALAKILGLIAGVVILWIVVAILTR